MPDLKADIHQFVIYETNGLIGKSIFGDQMLSVLRHVTVRGSPGEIIEEPFDNPYWVPILATDIDELHFEIRTLSGKYMPFQFGTIIMELMFKRNLGT